MPTTCSVSLYLACSATRSGISARQGPHQVAQKLTMTTFPRSDAIEISMASLRGKVVIVNFWATWCGPCRAEIPDLVALQEKYKDTLQIIGISEDEGGVDGVKRFAAEHRINYPVVMTTPALEKMFPGISALPTSFVI